MLICIFEFFFWQWLMRCLAVKDVSIDLDAMMGAKGKAVKGLTGGIEGLFKKYKVDYIKGFGSINGPGQLTAKMLEGSEEKSIKAKNIILATGSEVTPLPPVPVDNAGGRIVDSTGALDLKSIPKSMVVIGGGVIGLEMGSVWRRLGAEVTVVEFLDRIVPAVSCPVPFPSYKALKSQRWPLGMCAG